MLLYARSTMSSSLPWALIVASSMSLATGCLSSDDDDNGGSDDSSSEPSDGETPEISDATVELSADENRIQADWDAQEGVDAYNLIYGTDPELLEDPGNYGAYGGEMIQHLSPPAKLDSLDSEAIYHVVLEVERGDDREYIGSDPATPADEDGQLWVFDAHSGIQNNLRADDVVIHKGRAYSVGADDDVRAADAATGEQDWSYGHDDNVVAVAAKQDTVVSAGRDESVRALDAETGEHQWTFEGHDAGILALLAKEDTLYSAGRDTVRALDPQTGEQEWVWDEEGGRSIAVCDGDLCVASGNNVYALDPSSGEKQWVYEDHGHAVRAVAAEEGKVFIGGDGPWEETPVRAIDSKTHDTKWLFEGHDDTIRDLTLDEGTLLSSADDDTVRGIDPGSGEEQWVFDGNEDNVHGVAADGEVVYSASQDGIIRAFLAPERDDD